MNLAVARQTADPLPIAAKYIAAQMGVEYIEIGAHRPRRLLRE